MRLHHVQVACPSGGEGAARRFYVDGLGMTEVDKPADLVARGGCATPSPGMSGSTAPTPVATASRSSPGTSGPGRDGT